jgi:hypothetical protein
VSVIENRQFRGHDYPNANIVFHPLCC